MADICCIIPTALSSNSEAILLQNLHLLRASSIPVYLVITKAKKRQVPFYMHHFSKIVVSESESFAQKINTSLEALQKSKPKKMYYLLLNDDVLLTKTYIQHIKKIAKEAKVEAFSPLIRKKGTKQIDSFGIEYFSSGYAKNSQKIINSQAHLLSAACLLVSSSLLLKIKKKFGSFFNETYYYYMEDVDFSVRALMCGAVMEKSSHIEVEHAVSATSNEGSFFVVFHTYRNIIWLMIQMWPASLFVKHSLKFALVQCWLLLYTFLRGWPHLYPKLLLDTALSLNTLLKNRQFFQQSIELEVFEKLLSPYALKSRHLPVVF